MGRRSGMLITIICILVVGVSVTKMTRKFVASEGAGAAAITSVTEMAGGAAQQAVPIEAELPSASINQLNEQVTTKEEAAPDLAARTEEIPFTDAGEAKADGTGARSSGSKEAGSGMSADTAGAAKEDADGGEKEEAVTEVIVSVLTDAAAEAAGTEAAGTAEATAETVKSPLDPALETEAQNGALLNEAETVVLYTADELAERLSLAEEKSAAYRESVVESNMGSVYTAAEQERILWDKELNLIYVSIRSCMSEEEAKELKVSELEWLKERDLAADKAASRNTLPQNQNPDSVRVLAEKTRERCYELLSDYGDVLE